MAATILIIEDDQQFRDLLGEYLQEEGFQPLGARDGEEGIQMLQTHQPDLVLLDVMLPRVDGWETCRQIRQISDVPIVMLSGRASEQDRIRGLELGADDYVTKPFSCMDLVARIRAILQRGSYPVASEEIVEVDDHLLIDQARCEVWVDGQPIRLSSTEHRLLLCLLDHAGQVLTHQSLLTQVGGWEFADETDYLRAHIHSLRKKIERNPQEPQYIVNEWGQGYRFERPGS